MDTSNISFPKLESWNPMHEVATIAANVDKKRVLCRISKEVLSLVAKNKKADPMTTLADNINLFEKKARLLIENEAYEKDGSIIIRKVDMTK
jgi:uncharacterized protein DUF1488